MRPRRRPIRIRSFVVVAALAASITPAAHAAPLPSGSPQERSVDPVVLTGSQFPTWSAGADPTFREPSTPHYYSIPTITAEPLLPEPLQSDCYHKGPQYPNPYDPSDNGDHTCTQSSRVPRNPNVGAPVDRLLGYRWNGSSFEQIPFQVDERFTRYLSNNVSGFAFYSGTDQHTTYAFDREGFRYTSDASQTEGGDACLARPAPGSTMIGGYATTPDPVVGLDDDDEVAFMWSDAAGQAPPGTPLPDGIEGSYEIAIADPSNPGDVAFAYVMLAAPDGPTPAFDASNGYVRYQRDANADLFVYSESGNDNYGVAPKGPYCTEDGTPDTSHGAIAQRRPLDRAWVSTDRYAFRYDGRWLMTQLRISPTGTGLSTGDYGPDIVDQWKARAFQQRPGGQTPCCGYEEEVNNWGGSSILFGERVGPVRAIRATWGADSSTNSVRTEYFYRDDIRLVWHLRVHVIPPFDGVYVQWDYNAGRVGTYYNPWRPEGVAIDGQDDEVFGNSNVHLATDRIEVQDGDNHLTVPLAGGDPGRCDLPVQNEHGVCNDVDSPDPTFSGPSAPLNWEEIAGPNGTLVTRWSVKEHTAGDAYTLIALPYYRDDSCFDDGTGSDPGPHLRLRSVDDGAAATWHNPDTGMDEPRVCWTPADGIPSADPALARRFWQGDIATRGLHMQLIADSDNANLTVPVDEIVSEERMIVLPGDPGNVGEIYGRGTEFPLQARARIFT